MDIIDKAKAIIVFCPLVSRYETDILSALSSIPGRNPETQTHMEKFSYVCLFDAFNCDLCLWDCDSGGDASHVQQRPDSTTTQRPGQPCTRSPRGLSVSWANGNFEVPLQWQRNQDGPQTAETKFVNVSFQEVKKKETANRSSRSERRSNNSK